MNQASKWRPDDAIKSNRFNWKQRKQEYKKNDQNGIGKNLGTKVNKLEVFNSIRPHRVISMRSQLAIQRILVHLLVVLTICTMRSHAVFLGKNFNFLILLKLYSKIIFWHPIYTITRPKRERNLPRPKNLYIYIFWRRRTRCNHQPKANYISLLKVLNPKSRFKSRNWIFATSELFFNSGDVFSLFLV